jgi:hypothetical protein
VSATTEQISPPSSQPRPAQTAVQVWALDLYGSADMPDKRLNASAVRMVVRLAEAPTDPLTQACVDYAEIKAAYRLIENKRLVPEHLQRAMRQKGSRDAQGRPEILVIQDTTHLSFPRSPATEGLGPITNNTTPGLHVHTALAVGLDGKPIGILSQKVWARPWESEKPTPVERKRLPIEEKESHKWIVGMQESRQAIVEANPAGPRPRLIHVFDREGDIYEVFADVLEHEDGCVIRSTQNRRAADMEYTAIGENHLGGAHDLVAQSSLLGSIDVTVERNGERKGRVARVEIRSIALELHPACPYHKRAPLEIRMVEAREAGAPADVKEPILWRLLTTEPCTTFEEACGVVEIYTRRWLIEEVHLTLKSGCRIQDVRLRTARRIEILLAMYSAVAVFLLQLREWSRLDPEAPCTEVLDAETWPVLYAAVHGYAAPPDLATPTIRQAVLWIGRLGGHVGRKGDGMPGIRVLWRGWRDLSRFVAVARSLRIQRHAPGP